MSLLDIQNALASLTTMVNETEVNHKKRADEHESRLDKRISEITQAFSNQSSALKLEFETLKDNTRTEITETNNRIDKETEVITSFINNHAESAKLLALDSRINHANNQMKSVDLEISSRSFCVYGLPGISDTEINDAFTSIFSIAPGTSEPIKDIKSEITGAPGKKVKIFTAIDVNTAINTLTLMRKVVADYKLSPDKTSPFSKMGVGDYFYRSCIPVRSSLHSKGRLITQEIPWVNYCSIRFNRHNPEILLLANTSPEISNQLKLAEKQTYVRIDVGTELGQLMEMSNFNFRSAKTRRPKPTPEDPSIVKDSISIHSDSRDSSNDSRKSGFSFTEPSLPSSTRGGANRGRQGRPSTPKRKAGPQINPADVVNAVSKKSSLGKD
mgnify:CR=1 FL=1